MSTPAKENSRGDGGTVKTPSSVRARGEARGTRDRGGGGDANDEWMRCDFLNASIHRFRRRRDGRARVFFVHRARVLVFFYACGVAIGGLTMRMTTTVGRFGFSRAGRF